MTKTVTIDITGREIENVLTPLVCDNTEDFVVFLATVCSVLADPDLFLGSHDRTIFAMNVLRIALHDYLALLIKDEIQPYRVDPRIATMLKEFVEDTKLDILSAQDSRLPFVERPDGSVSIDLEKMYGSDKNTLKGKGRKRSK